MTRFLARWGVVLGVLVASVVGCGGSGGGGTAGTSGAAGSTGAATCGITTTDCSACVNAGACKTQHDTCSSDDNCHAAIGTFLTCVCSAQKAGDAAAKATCISQAEGTSNLFKPMVDCAQTSCAACGL
jgi:hypothetical protein